MNQAKNTVVGFLTLGAFIAALSVGAHALQERLSQRRIPQIAARPEITGFWPKEPDGAFWAMGGGPFTVFGKNFSPDPAKNRIVVRVFQEPAVMPVPPSELLAQIQPTAAAADRLDAVAPPNLAKATYLIFVQVDGAGASNMLAVGFSPAQDVREKRKVALDTAAKETAVKMARAAILPDLAGLWDGSTGLTYTITQSGTQCTWTDSNGITGIISSAASGLTSSWTDAAGPHSVTGVITESDTTGKPAKIVWSDGVVFRRAGITKLELTPIQLPAPKGIQANEVRLYMQPDFAGPFKSWRLETGLRQLSVPEVGDRWENHVASLQLGSDIGVMLFQNKDFRFSGSGYINFVSSVSDIKKTVPGAANIYGSMIVFERASANPLGFLAGNSARSEFRFFPMPEPASERNAGLGDIRTLVAPVDFVMFFHGAKIGEDLTLTLYSDNLFKGETLRLPDAGGAQSYQLSNYNFAGKPVSFKMGISAAGEIPLKTGAMDISGLWRSDKGVLYRLTQSGENITLLDDRSSVKGNGQITGDSLVMTWAEVAGRSPLTGKITAYDSSGQPARIAWSKDIVFTREPEMLQVTPVRGWCCVNGEVLADTRAECAKRGGVFFAGREDAEKYCRSGKAGLKRPETREAAEITALLEEGRRLGVIGEECRRLLQPAEERLLQARTRDRSNLREAELGYRAAITEALWGEAQRTRTRRPIDAGQLEAVAVGLFGDDESDEGTVEFVKRVSKVRTWLAGGSGLADLRVELWADVGIRNTGLDPSPPLTDRPTRLGIVVENIGFTSVTVPFLITVQVDGQPVHTWTFSPVAEAEDPSHSWMPLSPGKTRVYSTHLSPMTGGTHTVKVEADPQGAVPEIDESNNSFEIAAHWQDPPNLRVRSVREKNGSGGGQKTLWEVEIENVGEGDAVGPFLTVFQPHVPGASQENFWVQSLPAQTMTSFTSTQWLRSSGTFTVTATVDAGWAVPEAEPAGENDNTWEKSVTLAPVDLRVYELSVTPAKVVSWQPMTAAITIKNTGTGKAVQPFKVRITPGTMDANGMIQPREYTINGLAAGGSEMISHSVILRPGRYSLAVEVDSDATFFEASKDNNMEHATVDCQGMRGGRVYIVDGLDAASLVSFINNDPKLPVYRKKVALVALKEAMAQPPICDDAAEDKYGAWGAWCSEFVRWVFLQAGMKNISCGFFTLSMVNVNSMLVTLFSCQSPNRFLWREKGEVTPQTMEPGDYISWNNSGKKKQHASVCVAVSQDGTMFWSVHGNCGPENGPKCVCLGCHDYFADGVHCIPDIDGVGKIGPDLFTP